MTVFYSRKNRAVNSIDKSQLAILAAAKPKIGQLTIRDFFRKRPSDGEDERSSNEKRNVPLRGCADPEETEGATEEHTGSVAAPSGATDDSHGAIDRVAEAVGLEQTVLDFGQKTFTTCPECKMAYCLIDAEDTLAHKRFHKAFTGGLFLKRISPKAFEKISDQFPVYRLLHPCSSKEWATVLQISQTVQTEMNAAEIPESELKSLFVFLFAGSDSQIIGAVFAEKIASAFPLLSFDSSIPFIDLNEKREAKLGISRIWVASKFRRQNVAFTLLDAILEHFQKMFIISKQHIAFSQPTDMGYRLACKWFGCKDFLVYKA